MAIATDLWCSSECTPPCQGGGRGFKSRQVRHRVPTRLRAGGARLPGRVAQLVERAPEKREVTGSTPVPTTGKSLFRGYFDHLSVVRLKSRAPTWPKRIRTSFIFGPRLCVRPRPARRWNQGQCAAAARKKLLSGITNPTESSCRMSPSTSPAGVSQTPTSPPHNLRPIRAQECWHATTNFDLDRGETDELSGRRNSATH